MHPYRTHRCDELRPEHIGTEVRIAGWFQNVRDHGGLVFLDVRDHYGVTQVTIPAQREDLRNILSQTPKESTLSVVGVVTARPPSTVNPKLATGEVELVASNITITGLVREPLPFEVYPEREVGDEQRLKHRFLDLRRGNLHQNIVLRSRIIQSLRNRMLTLGFLELQTPILTSSSPEGARDYLVPSRLHRGKF